MASKMTINQFYAEMNIEIARRELQGMTHYYPETIKAVIERGGTPEEAAHAIHQVWYWRNGGAGPSIYWK